MIGEGSWEQADTTEQAAELSWARAEYLNHPAYAVYKTRLEHLIDKSDEYAWELGSIDSSVDSTSFAAMSPEEQLAFFFMAGHRLQAEHKVAVLLAAFSRAVPWQDVHTQAMLARQTSEEYKHTIGVYNFYKDVIGLGDFEQMKQMAEQNADQVSTSLYGLLEKYINALSAEPSLRNLIGAFFAYHVVAEGVVAREFSKLTAQKMSQDNKFPGFLDGHAKVARDENRHVAFGMAFLRMTYEIYPELTRQIITSEALEFKQEVDRQLVNAIEDNLGELTQIGYGKTPQEIHALINKALERNLRAISPKLREEYLTSLDPIDLTQNVDGPGSNQHDR
ncbi:MAG TPA: hypothetical protein VFP35_02945 [Candidatus Saccharimonadales bacterium]|nr:hypothetical protein [Candidatus Saccharimonadales bacterium]